MLDLRSRLRKRFSLPFDGGEAIHVMEPSLTYSLVSHQSQAGDPLFIPRTAAPQLRLRQLHLDNVLYDPADRIESFNGFTLSLANRFYGQRPPREEGRR